MNVLDKRKVAIELNADINGTIYQAASDALV
jgi:hypothetical protein